MFRLQDIKVYWKTAMTGRQPVPQASLSWILKTNLDTAKLLKYTKIYSKFAKVYSFKVILAVSWEMYFRFSKQNNCQGINLPVLISSVNQLKGQDQHGLLRLQQPLQSVWIMPYSGLPSPAVVRCKRQKLAVIRFLDSVVCNMGPFGPE